MKKNSKNILAAIAISAALSLSAGAFIRQISSEKTKELNSYSYTICEVTEEGNINKDEKTSLVSDKLNASDLVSIEVKEDADVAVYVLWYNEDGDFLKKDVVEGEIPEAPEGADKVRVEIEPLEDDDGEISVFEKGGYAKLVTVTLKK